MIAITCFCGKTLKVKDELAGKRGKCPSCGEAIVVPSPRRARTDGTGKSPPAETPERAHPPSGRPTVASRPRRDWLLIVYAIPFFLAAALFVAAAVEGSKGSAYHAPEIIHRDYCNDVHL